MAPYVPNLVVDWLGEQPESTYRTLEGTFVFADISGFTALTERLAIRGKAGAEEMGDLLNVTFEALLTCAYDYGASLLKWGGDAVLLLFDDVDHPARAARAAWEMQQRMRTAGWLRTSVGSVRLGMSIGIHTGVCDFLLVGTRHRELVVTGPAASRTAQMEKAASRGQVVLSETTSARLPARCLGAPVADGVLLARPPDAPRNPNRRPKRTDVDLTRALDPLLAAHVRAGQVEDEHRAITVGFLLLSGTDELPVEDRAAAVEDVVQRVQRAATAHDVALLASDLAEDGAKLILVAGAPVSTGDDEARVLSTLVRTVSIPGPLKLRAGVTCGNVFAGDYGPFYRRTYSITGDTVNLAARLMAKAAPGQVLATPAVVARSRTPFETEALEPFAVKGKRAPVRAVIVREPRRARQHDVDDGQPLVGRDRELNQLLTAARLAAQGQGQVVDLVAPAGMGKSRLIDEVSTRAELRVLHADGDIYGKATPYQPFQRMLRNALGMANEVEGDLLRPVLQQLVSSVAPDLVPWLPLIGVVAGVELPATDEVELLDPEVRRSRLEAVTSELLGRLLTEPSLMVLNDAHFMDEATLALVRRLGTDAAERPWLLVVSRRPDVPSPVDPAEYVATVELEPLDPTATRALLELATDQSPLPTHRLRQLTELAGGNPLFLWQLVSAALAGADLDALPDSVEALIAAQIDRLPQRRRAWLRAASVLGMTVDRALLQDVLADTDLQAEDGTGLGDLIAPAEDGTLQFSHHLIRLTAYEGLSYRRRTALHARSAELLEQRLEDRAGEFAEVLSLHCLRGERHDAAWRYARMAGDRAKEAYAPTEAAKCYRRAVEAGRHLTSLTGPELAEVYEQLAQAHLDAGDTREAEESLRHARACAKHEPLQLAGLIIRTARLRQHRGRHADAVRWVMRGRAILRDNSDPAAQQLLAELAEIGALVRRDQGHYRTATTWARRAVIEARAAGDRATEVRGLGILAIIAALSGEQVEEDVLRVALAKFDETGDHRGKGRTANVLGMCAYFAGRWEEALRHYTTAEEAYARIGFESGAAAAAANRAEVLVQQGRATEAIAVLDPALRIWVTSNALSYLMFGLSLYGRAEVELGRYDSAMNRLHEAHRLAMEMGEEDEALSLDAFAAECFLRAGEAGQARDFAEDAIERASRMGDRVAAVPLLTRIHGEAVLVLGEQAGGSELRAALADAEASDSPYDVEATLTALLRLGVATDDAEASQWSQRHQELVQQLGIKTPELV